MQREESACIASCPRSPWNAMDGSPARSSCQPPRRAGIRHSSPPPAFREGLTSGPQPDNIFGRRARCRSGTERFCGLAQWLRFMRDE